jgi:hypothetical protein
MWDYFSMFLWVIIAFVGLAIYMNPSFLVRHSYTEEGFEVQTATQAAKQTATQTSQQQKPLDINSMLRNLEQILHTPGNVPDVNPSMPSQPQPITYTAGAGAGRQQPAESEQNKSSIPQPLNEPVISSNALAQGKAFQSTKPQVAPTQPQAAAVKEIIKERIVEVPVPRTCPRQQECPVCPDMQNYIRKDSIPCWACKL